MQQHTYAGNGTGAHTDSNTSANTLLLWASRPVSSWLGELTEAAKQEEQAYKQQLDIATGRVREQQQQLEAEQAARSAAEEQVAQQRRLNKVK